MGRAPQPKPPALLGTAQGKAGMALLPWDFGGAADAGRSLLRLALDVWWGGVKAKQVSLCRK